MTTIVDINDSDLISASNEVINDNFDALNTGKIETSVIDTDITLAANSDLKLPSQKAVKAYVDANIDTGQTLTQASSVLPAINTDTYNRYVLTAQKTDITSFTTNLTGSPTDGDKLVIRIVNGLTTIALVNYSEYHDASSDTAVVTKPSGTANDDIMFAIIESATAYSNGAPNGWTSLAQTNSTGFYEVYYKVASGEGTDYTWTFAAAQKVKITILSYRGGFNVSDPIDVFSDTAYVYSNALNIAASMNVTYENSPLLFFGCSQGTSAVTSTKPSIPTTDWAEDYDSGNTDPDYWLEVCSMTWTGSGYTGNMVSTLSATKTDKHAFAIALKPAIEVTWGAKFTSIDNSLSTVVLKGETKEVDLVYNSASTTWVTDGNTGNTGETAAELIADTQVYQPGVMPNDYIKTFYNIHMPFRLWDGAVANDTTTTNPNWIRTDATKVVIPPGAFMASFASTADAVLYIDSPLYSSGSTVMTYAATNKIILDFNFKYISGAGEAILGFTNSGTDLSDVYAAGGSHYYIAFHIANGVLYALTWNNTVKQRTDISSGITLTDWNNFRIEMRSGSQIADFYVNGVLKVSITDATVLNNSAPISFGFGRDTTNPVLFNVTAPFLSLELNP